MPFAIQQSGHVHRLFMPIFLHFGICHLFVNTLLLVSLGTIVESVMCKDSLVSGKLRFIMLIITVTVASNLTAAAINTDYAIGAEPLIFGFLGSMMMTMVVYWPQLGGEFCAKLCAVFMIVLVLIISILLTTS